MPTVRIRNIPPEVHAALSRRAAAARLSLEDYLRDRLVDEASRPSPDEVLARSSGRAGGSLTAETAANEVRSDRRRDQPRDPA